MTWTYDSTDLSTNLAKVRLMIGDTDTTDQQLTDEEIQFYIDDSGTNLKTAAARCCQALAAQYARLADKEVGDLKIWYSQRHKHYLSLADELSGLSLVTEQVNLYAGGISEADKDTVDDDTDRVPPRFVRNQFIEGATDLDPDNSMRWDT